MTATKAKSSNRGSKPGEHRGGRVKGQPNKVQAHLKDMAREYTTEALEALVGVLRESPSDAAKVAAANAILDRGYGKPSQVLNGDEDGGAVKLAHVIELVGIRPK